MSKPHIVVFVQARMGSARLPGKVLKEVLGRPILLHQIDRIKRAKLPSDVVVITTERSTDDAIAALCETHSIPYFRGNETDLLDRHYQAAKKFGADFVAKIGADCPLTDPAIIDEVLGLWKNHPNTYDYVSNYHPPTFPDGLDVEGSPLSILEIAWREAKKPHEREHTFPFIWDQPGRFRIGNIKNPRGDMFMTHRFTLDYPEDWEFVERIYTEFGHGEFSFDDVLDLLKRKPEIAKLNDKHNGVNWYRTVEGKLKTVKKDRFRHGQDSNDQTP